MKVLQAGLLAALVLFSAAAARAQARAVPLVAVDAGDKDQTMDHFGVSGAWWSQAAGTWPAERRDRVLDLLFSPVKGIGLNLIRYNIGGGKNEADLADPWRSAESPLAADGSLDWSRDGAAMAIVDAAAARGAQVLLFANSPPAAFTISGKPTGLGTATNLAPSMVGRFAAFLADCVEELSRRWPVVAVSPINEPQWAWSPTNGQEGCHYEPEEAIKLVETLIGELRSRDLPVPVSAFDSGAWTLRDNARFLDALEARADLRPWLAPLSVHSYWSDGFDKRLFRLVFDQRFPGWRVWQTEWTQMRPGKGHGMDEALVLAQVVNEDLTVGRVSSWQGWIGVSKYDYADGLIYADESGASIQATKKLWALGQWSRFVWPGSVRVRVRLPPELPLQASAFERPDGSLVLVLVNANPAPVGPFALDQSVSGRWETSEKRDLEPVSLRGPLWAPARSVTTFLLEGRPY